jgi:hypothetical protein
VQPSLRGSSRIRLLAFLAAVLFAASVTTAVSSLAVFTDLGVESSTFQSASVDIGVTPASAAFSVAGMRPGDARTAYITVTDAGTLQVRWRVDSSATGTGGLQDAITVAIAEMPSGTCAAWDGASPAPLAAGPLSSVSLTGRILDPAGPGNTSGMCFRASLPAGAAASLQNRTATAIFVFTAEQTAHN